MVSCRLLYAACACSHLVCGPEVGILYYQLASAVLSLDAVCYQACCQTTYTEAGIVDILGYQVKYKPNVNAKNKLGQVKPAICLRACYAQRSTGISHCGTALAVRFHGNDMTRNGTPRVQYTARALTARA
eukprot:3465144-Rhodomonas_salina.2